MGTRLGVQSWGPLENLALSEAELAGCDPIGGESGAAIRARCPFHGSDHQRSLRVKCETGHFKCHACGAWGYLDTARERRPIGTYAPPKPRVGGARPSSAAR